MFNPRLTKPNSRNTSYKEFGYHPCELENENFRPPDTANWYYLLKLLTLVKSLFGQTSCTCYST